MCQLNKTYSLHDRRRQALGGAVTAGNTASLSNKLNLRKTHVHLERGDRKNHLTKLGTWELGGVGRAEGEDEGRRGVGRRT